MAEPQSIESLMVGPGPRTMTQRLLLHTVRRMAAGGLDDAFAAHGLIGSFGHGFRRPLVLIRALMAEMSRVSARKLVVAPCCCPRVTRDEMALLEAIAAAPAQPHAAHERLRGTLAVANCLGVLTSAQAVAQAFADLGRPLEA